MNLLTKYIVRVYNLIHFIFYIVYIMEIVCNKILNILFNIHSLDINQIVKDYQL